MLFLYTTTSCCVSHIAHHLDWISFPKHLRVRFLGRPIYFLCLCILFSWYDARIFLVILETAKPRRHLQRTLYIPSFTRRLANPKLRTSSAPSTFPDLVFFGPRLSHSSSKKTSEHCFALSSFQCHVLFQRWRWHFGAALAHSRSSHGSSLCTQPSTVHVTVTHQASRTSKLSRLQQHTA